MKHIKILFTLFLMVTLFACENEYEPLNEYSDVDWYTSGFQNDKVVGLNKYMSFSDLSHNAMSHSWSFSDTSGCKFLKGNITRQDSTYIPFIDESLDTISDAGTVHVLFTTPGLKHIRLRNTFVDNVSFKGNDTLEAVNQNGEWLIDTSFVVDVYDSIQSAFKVFRDGIELVNVDFDQQVFLSDSSSWPVQEVMAGEKLEFVDMSTVGRPDSRTWYLNGGNPSTSADSVALINYYKLGTYYARMVSSRSGQNIPAGSKMKYIPLKVEVIKSTLAFKLSDDIVETDDEVLILNMTGEVSPFSGLESDFTVHVTNANGFDQNIEVQSASVSATSGTTIELKLAEPIYNSDVITVSYVGGTINSLDERQLEAFSLKPVTMYQPNLITNPGFEDTDNLWGTPHTFTDGTTPAKGAELSMDNPKNGDFSMYVNKTVDDANVGFGNSGSFILEAGVKYTYRYDYYIVNDGAAVWEPRISLANSDGTVVNGKLYGGWFNPNGEGVWQTKEDVINGDAGSYTVAFLCYGGGKSIEAYLDNFFLGVYEGRPTE
ncbi:hypothetical protein [Saccharicrinis aurantiacus]|uniref:hypothetical protein n=1 Tax=Saccharicrinis aurantiacus TaxID=1849719 RepID=UPI00249145C5|nr:hypothetical protein [Saccharicrinis aurantiacus]